MRLQLALLTVTFLSVTIGRARSEPQAYARVDVYSDEWITVVSPATMAVIDATDTLEVSARYTVDVLSGATPVMTTDIITSATPFAEERHEGEVGVKYRPDPTWSVGASYTASYEPDYQTHAAGVSADVELFDRLAQAAASYHVKIDNIGLSTDKTFSQGVIGHLVDLSWSQILDRNTVASLLVSGSHWSCADEVGCHSSPYRYVPIVAAEGPSNATRVALRERHPSTRGRGAVALRASRHLIDDLALHAGYRFYADTWKITGHTVDLAAAQSLLDDAILLRLEGRMTIQSAASFYRDRYEASATMTDLPRYRSGDREVAGLAEYMVGGRAEWTADALGPFSRLRINARLGRYWYRYPNYSVLPTRRAWLIGGGLNASF